MKYLTQLILVAACSCANADAQPVPNITATAWLVATGTGETITSQNANEQRSIASITKLMTAMVVLDANQNLDEKLGLYTRRELLDLMLVKSDNQAAETLCEHYPLGRSRCVYAMNVKAVDLGVSDTHYIDPSGLGIMNVSTANDLVKIVIAASEYPVINHASNTATGQVKKKKQWLWFRNTNPLVATQEFIVSKTGYIRASGGCIVMMLDTKLGRRIVVLLNSKNTHTRIPEAQYMAMNY